MQDEEDESSGLRWPIERSCLVKLIDIGFSDKRIGVCFSVSETDVRDLKEKYSLLSRAPSSTAEDLAMDDLYNGIQAAATYASSALNCAQRDGVKETQTIQLLRRALEQILRAGRACHMLNPR